MVINLVVFEVLYKWGCEILTVEVNGKVVMKVEDGDEDDKKGDGNLVFMIFVGPLKRSFGEGRKSWG